MDREKVRALPGDVGRGEGAAMLQARNQIGTRDERLAKAGQIDRAIGNQAFGAFPRHPSS
jgi:hypothetical protein